MEMLKRKDNESESQYIKRLIYGKLVDKTIDLDYSELTQLMYGKPYSSDVGRRICYGWRDAFKLRKFIDYVYFGHLHHYSRKTVSTGKTNNKEVIYLPSIMGEDEYSQDFMFGGAKASAILDVYEKDKGIKNTYNIIVN